MVTAFYLTQRLLQIAMQQLQQLGNSTWPAMSELYHQNDHEKFVRRIIEVTEFISFSAGVLLSVLTFINPAFVVLWTGAATFAGLTLSNIVILNTGLIAINSFWLWCFAGVGMINKAIPILILQAVVNVIISWVGAIYFGYLGPAIGTFISFLFITQIGTTWLLHKEFSVPIARLTRAWLIPFFLPVCLCIAITYTVGPPQMQSWWTLILGASIYGSIALGSFPFLFVNPKSRNRILLRVRKTLVERFSKKK